MHERMTVVRRQSPTCKATLRHDLKATHCNTLQLSLAKKACQLRHQRGPSHKTLQHTETHCNTLKHTATHCNANPQDSQPTAAPAGPMPQHNATYCNTLTHDTACGLRLAVGWNKLISGASAYNSGYMYTSPSTQVHLHISTSTSTADCGAGACRCRHPHPPCGCQQMRQRAHPDRQSQWTPKSRLRYACLAISLLPATPNVQTSPTAHARHCTCARHPHHTSNNTNQSRTILRTTQITDITKTQQTAVCRIKERCIGAGWEDRGTTGGIPARPPPGGPCC